MSVLQLFIWADAEVSLGAVINMMHFTQAYPTALHLNPYLHSAGYKERKYSCGCFVVRSNQNPGGVGAGIRKLFRSFLESV